jgi:cytochrome b6-f complex iron-sulfur subunit
MAQATVANTESGVSRRRLFRWALLGVAGAVVAQAGLAFVYFFNPQKTGAFGGIVNAGNLADLPQGSMTRIPKGKYYLSHTDKGLMALFWRCRHLGCTVPWNPNQAFATTSGETVQGVFQCPCHGSTYTRDGQLQFGPAPGPLDIMRMTIGQDGLVSVDTGAIRRRDRATDQHYVAARPGASGPEAPDLRPQGTGI